MDLEILRIATKTKNNKIINKPTHSSKLKNSLCGDEIHIKLIMKKNKIIDFGYQSKSCVYCQASASLLSKVSIGKKSIYINELCDDAKSFFESGNDIMHKKWVIFNRLFNIKNLAQKECILLPFKALKKIVSD
tara:strand:+ start:391 stop:789 length:399 start_codon:yes stop_codon:yes gene_type:complete